MSPESDRPRPGKVSFPGRGVSALRNSILIVLCLAVWGCGSPLRALPPPGLQPAKEVVVFCDGFHSGLVFAWPQPEIAGLDLQTGDDAAKKPWFETGFGADAWTRLGGGCCIAARLVMFPSNGVMMIRHLDEPCPPRRDKDTEVRTWKLSLDQAGWEALTAYLNHDLDKELNFPRRPGALEAVLFLTTRWSLFHNCNDWTYDGLRAAGLQLKGHSIISASDVVEDMDAAVKELAQAGITVVGPIQPSPKE